MKVKATINRIMDNAEQEIGMWCCVKNSFAVWMFIMILLKVQPYIAGHAPLFKQFTELFENSPYAELLTAKYFANCG